MKVNERRRIPWLILLTVLLLAACNGLPGTRPRLLSESDIPTVAVLPSITPSKVPTNTPTSTPVTITPDVIQETEVALVTPTLPPTLMPTQTFTPSPTHTNTPTPTWTPWPTLTPFPPATFPPALVQPTQPFTTGQTIAPAIVNAVSAPTNPDGSCTFQWFFGSRVPAGCPTAAAVSSPGAYLEFEQGRMFWFGVERMIYVLYNDGARPAWERYPDMWFEGMPERDPTIIGPLGLWQQPRRGFGHLWRSNPQVRSRLGWARHEWETSFTGTLQQAGIQGGSTIFITDPNGLVFQLQGDQTRFEPFNR